MYRQLDEAILERFEAVGRVRDDKSRPKNAGEWAVAVDWPRHRDWGPGSLHCTARQTEQSGPYELPGPDGRVLVWTGNPGLREGPPMGCPARWRPGATEPGTNGLVRACPRRVRIGVADQVKKILGWDLGAGGC
jgi:hypothetical protein